MTTRRMCTYIALLLAFSCSQVNRSSRDQYKENKKIKHGIVILDDIITPKGMNTDIVVDLKASGRGKALYQKNCLKCHGANGEGDGKLAKELGIKPANLKNLAKTTHNFKFYMSISQWDGQMPGWWERELTDLELMDISHYLKKLAHQK